MMVYDATVRVCSGIVSVTMGMVTVALVLYEAASRQGLATTNLEGFEMGSRTDRKVVNAHPNLL